MSKHGRPDVGLLARVVGAGPGLTPAGDDFLVGLCCALHGLRHPLLGLVNKVLPALLSSTTLVSQTLLCDSLDGSFQLPLVRLRQALMSNVGPSQLRAALHQAMNIGASSGCDGAWGLSSGLQLFHESKFERSFASMQVAG